MATPLRIRRLAPLARPLLTLGLALLTTLACVRGREDVPPQGWWDGLGPVIPHDKFPADCSLCHTGQGWQEIRDDFALDHAAETGYPLEGAHAAAQCLRCHNDRGPAADFAARGCGGCHEDVHLGQLGTNCEDCHEQPDWRPRGRISEHAKTRFPLMGAHAATACRACHPAAELGVFVPTDTECLSCHRDDLARAKDPDHLAQGWTDGCDRCHISTSWGGAAFNHGWWPLTGAHGSASCKSCHSGGVYAGTDPACFSCHSAEYTGAADPDHVALNLPTACRQCHTTRGWKPADMDHSVLSGSCVSCHLADYQATTDPDHQALGIPTTCEDCHSTRNWRDANFDHAGIASGCVNCHLDDYQATTNPNHIAAGFPTTCEDCHDTVRWRNGTFDHDFPITSGKHKGFNCNRCHLNSSNYADFSCTHCHAHRKSEMDDEHDGVSGYVWSSPACYTCHPDGRE